MTSQTMWCLFGWQNAPYAYLTYVRCFQNVTKVAYERVGATSQQDRPLTHTRVTRCQNLILPIQFGWKCGKPEHAQVQPESSPCKMLTGSIGLRDNDLMTTFYRDRERLILYLNYKKYTPLTQQPAKSSLVWPSFAPPSQWRIQPCILGHWPTTRNLACVSLAP